MFLLVSFRKVIGAFLFIPWYLTAIQAGQTWLADETLSDCLWLGMLDSGQKLQSIQRLPLFISAIAAICIVTTQYSSGNCTPPLPRQVLPSWSHTSKSELESCGSPTPGCVLLFHRKRIPLHQPWLSSMRQDRAYAPPSTACPKGGGCGDLAHSGYWNMNNVCSLHYRH